ncbi:uncharacterized protein [Pocillopora verrucosa]|uniref:uncharacterized protein n=1 Tax=Pocillopora verrucosa TaxID=203993 RepID=UPI003340885E
MGNYCSTCGDKITEGNYCERCYERQFPVCKHCKEPIRDGEERFGGCHKNPCYSDKTGRCCQCNDIASQGSYCQSCYDSEYPPPLRAEASGRGMSFRFYSRQEPNQRMIGSAMYSLGQGIAHALTDGGHKLCLPAPE